MIENVQKEPEKADEAVVVQTRKRSSEAPIENNTAKRYCPTRKVLN